MKKLILLLLFTTSASSDCLYTYKAEVVSAYDADTISININLGLNTWKLGEKVRLSRINAPEVRGEERPDGIISRDWLRNRIVGKQITIKTEKDKSGKYGRLIAEIYLDGVNINDELVDRGFAVYKDY